MLNSAFSQIIIIIKTITSDYDVVVLFEHSSHYPFKTILACPQLVLLSEPMYHWMEKKQRSGLRASYLTIPFASSFELRTQSNCVLHLPTATTPAIKSLKFSPLSCRVLWIIPSLPYKSRSSFALMCSPTEVKSASILPGVWVGG